MAKSVKKGKMTYAEMVDILLNVVENGEILEGDKKTVVTDKLKDFKSTLERKAEYSATHPKKTESKASVETLELVKLIGDLLKDGQVRTNAEIAQELGMELTPLRISNIVKKIDGVQKTKKIAEVINSKGLRQEKEFVAYFI